MIGATNPLASAPGTIRGDYGIAVGRNLIHGSDSVESAQREIAVSSFARAMESVAMMTEFVHVMTWAAIAQQHSFVVSNWP